MCVCVCARARVCVYVCVCVSRVQPRHQNRFHESNVARVGILLWL